MPLLVKPTCTSHMNDQQENHADRRITLGKISGAHGVKGWVKVFSETQPRENAVNYSPWQLKLRGEWQEYEVLAGRRHGKTVVVNLAGIEDRDAAAALNGVEIAIWRSQLPPPAEGEFYWTDLEGLAVKTTEGLDLGTVSHLVETGSNDVLVVREPPQKQDSKSRERLVPFIREQVIKAIDFDAGIITVDWDPEF